MRKRGAFINSLKDDAELNSRDSGVERSNDSFPVFVEIPVRGFVPVGFGRILIFQRV